MTLDTLRSEIRQWPTPLQFGLAVICTITALLWVVGVGLVVMQ